VLGDEGVRGGVRGEGEGGRGGRGERGGRGAGRGGRGARACVHAPFDLPPIA
jgi:hypothetical protein